MYPSTAAAMKLRADAASTHHSKVLGKMQGSAPCLLWPPPLARCRLGSWMWAARGWWRTMAGGRATSESVGTGRWR
eukprot:12900344-Prorocentrum_lima.AAC.1